MTIRILLADDHLIVREGLRQLINQQSDMRVAVEAASGDEAIRLARETEPHVAILDISMPVLNGLEAARRIVAERPATAIIMLSMHSSRHFVHEALRAGARGYVLKEAAFTELIAAIQAVRAQRYFLSAAIGERTLEDFVAHLRQESSGASPLSPREREVLQLIAEGHGAKAIALRLKVSVKTVETHRAHLMEKLGVASVAELTKYAIREGITSVE